MMKTLKVVPALLMLMILALITGCNGEKDGPNIPGPATISEGIIGKWLLATSTDKEWTVYEFKESQQMTSEWFVNNTLISGGGSFFTNDEKSSLTGSINYDRGNYVYFDWIVNKIQAFQVDIDVYSGDDGNQYLFTSSLYRIVGEVEGEQGSSFKPEYHKMIGTDDCSDFSAIEGSIVSVNEDGEIECLESGSTYVTFNTPAGRAAVRIIVLDKRLSFSENILGAWVTDNKGFVWERDVFGEDGYFYAQWSREVIYPTSDESAQGKYTVNEAEKIISISAKTPYNQKLNVQYHVTQIDRFSFNADIYSGGDKTGTYYYQRVLSSLTIGSGNSEQPNYNALVGSYRITGFHSHDDKVATVDEKSGLIKGISKGMTYIDVITNNGTGVVEVTVSDENLASDLFPDYSVLVGMTKYEVIKKMGREPDLVKDESQSFFFYDNKGIAIVSAYYTDFVNLFDNVKSVVTMFDDTLTEKQITEYLKNKYPYYPEYSKDDELLFIPENQEIVIYYMPKDKMIMYISATESTRGVVPGDIIAELKIGTRSIKR